MTVWQGMNKDITYWAPAGENKYGESAFATPVVFKGRYEDRAEKYRLPSGDEIVSKAVVWVPSDVELGGYLAEGDLSAQSDPTMGNANQILTIIRIPSMRTNRIERRAIL